MTNVCCVEGCDSASKDDVTYFQFPIKPTLRRKWREAINSTAKLPVDAAVCSQHFASCDYETVRGRVRLKGKVVPTVFATKEAKITQSNENDKKTENGSPSHNEIPENNNTDSQNNSEVTRNNSEISRNNSESEHNNSEDAPNLDCTNFMQIDFGYPLQHSNGSVDENCEENCTIECAPEALITQDSDSNSELEIHKEDIEDIIANYHIEQNKLVAERLKAAQLREAENEEKQKKENKDEEEKKRQEEKRERKPEVRRRESRKEIRVEIDDKSDDDVIEVPSKEPVFIEVSVGGSAKNTQDDCLMLLENVQVDIDPNTLMLPERETEVEPCPPVREDPISLLTSSDEDDVILQEPKIDTVEVSDEDEDDVPLVKLVKTSDEQRALKKILWGSLHEYFCFECHYKTTSQADFKRHKEQHSTVIQMCEVCNFTSASKAQFTRHKRKHKEEKRFKCHLCDYKARHNMSLIYHLKSHGGMTIVKVKDNAVKVKKCFKCQKCKFETKIKLQMLRHVRKCSGWTDKKLYTCEKCEYSTNRSTDLKRHVLRKHQDSDDENEHSDWS